MKLSLIFIFLSISSVISTKKKSNSKASSAGASTSHVAKDDDDMSWYTGAPTDPLRDSYSNSKFQNKDEYMEILSKAFEYSTKELDGLSLRHDIMFHDKDVFFDTIRYNEEIERERLPQAKDSSVILKDKLSVTITKYLLEMYRPQYVWKFFCISLKALIDHGKPSTAIFELFAELHHEISFVRASIKSMVFNVKKHSNKEFRGQLTPVVKEYVAGLERDLSRVQSRIRSGEVLDRKILEHKERWERVIGFFYEDLSRFRNEMNMVDDIAARVINLNLAKLEDVKRSIEEDTFALRTIYEMDMSHNTYQIFWSVDNIILYLRLYKMLLPLVNWNKKFMSEIHRAEPMALEKSPQTNMPKKCSHAMVLSLAGDTFADGTIRYGSMPIMLDAVRFKVAKLTQRFGIALSRVPKFHDDEIFLKSLEWTKKMLDTAMEEAISPLTITDEYITEAIAPAADLDQFLKVIGDFNFEIPVIKEESPSNTIPPEKESLTSTSRIKIKGKRYDWLKNDLCFNIQSLPKGYLRYTNPNFLLEPIADPTRKSGLSYLPRKNFYLDKQEFDILCKLTLYQSMNMDWKKVEDFLKNSLNAIFRPISGSRDSLYVPTRWSKPVDFHRPHSTKVGRPVAKALYTLLRNWGIFIGKFKFVPYEDE